MLLAIFRERLQSYAACSSNGGAGGGRLGGDIDLIART
jgi:hypothetical protein